MLPDFGGAIRGHDEEPWPKSAPAPATTAAPTKINLLIRMDYHRSKHAKSESYLGNMS
jgi:hypothetical protein